MGQSQLELEVAHGASVDGLLQRLVSDYPRLAGLARFLMVAVNTEYTTLEQTLQPGDEVAFIPPVSGGCHV